MTAQKVRTNIYLDKNVKAQAKELFNKYHISLSDAINLFLSQSVLEQGLPFEMKIPNKETIQAIKAIKNGDIENITFEQLQEDVKKCICN